MYLLLADGGSLPINACQYPKDKYEGEHWSHFYAAVDYRRWDGGSVCGKCVKVTGAAGTHIAKIVGKNHFEIQNENE